MGISSAVHPIYNGDPNSSSYHLKLYPISGSHDPKHEFHQELIVVSLWSLYRKVKVSLWYIPKALDMQRHNRSFPCAIFNCFQNLTGELCWQRLQTSFSWAILPWRRFFHKYSNHKFLNRPLLEVIDRVEPCQIWSSHRLPWTTYCRGHRERPSVEEDIGELLELASGRSPELTSQHPSLLAQKMQKLMIEW